MSFFWCGNNKEKATPPRTELANMDIPASLTNVFNEEFSDGSNLDYILDKANGFHKEYVDYLLLFRKQHPEMCHLEAMRAGVKEFESMMGFDIPFDSELGEINTKKKRKPPLAKIQTTEIPASLTNMFNEEFSDGSNLDYILDKANGFHKEYVDYLLLFRKQHPEMCHLEAMRAGVKEFESMMGFDIPKGFEPRDMTTKKSPLGRGRGGSRNARTKNAKRKAPKPRRAKGNKK